MEGPFNSSRISGYSGSHCLISPTKKKKVFSCGLRLNCGSKSKSIGFSVFARLAYSRLAYSHRLRELTVMQSNCLRYCLRIRTPIFQSVRHASGPPARPSWGTATYAPSPIFGAFKPSRKETVKKPLPPEKPSPKKPKPSKTDSKTGEEKEEKPKEEKPKPPLTEDEKIVLS
jgi:hypothetical protein